MLKHPEGQIKTENRKWQDSLYYRLCVSQMDLSTIESNLYSVSCREKT